MSKPREPFLHRRVRLVHRDETLWVLDKPPGVLSHPNPPRLEDPQAVVRAPYDFEREAYRVRDEEGETYFLHLVHRLDADTSGLLLLSRSASAASDLREALYRREVSKEYRALVLGVPRLPEGTWQDALRKSRGQGQVKVEVVRGERSNAETHYRVLRTFPRAGASLLALEPITGRTHQLRVQAAHRRLPIAGDERYGDFAANKRLRELVGLGRMFLHAYRLELRHPRSGHRLVFTAELTGPLAGPLERLAELREPVRSRPS